MKKIVTKIDNEKDASGAYTKSPAPSPEPQPVVADLSLDAILNKQLLALERVTKQLLISASGGAMSNAEIQSLATCIRTTLELKAKEKELLDFLSDEELEKASNAD